jgi:hypothetical protein
MEKTNKGAAKRAVPKRAASANRITLNAEERYQQIAALAYSLAEKNNFFGNQDDYWYAAERVIDDAN